MKISDEDLARLGFKRLQFDLPDTWIKSLYDLQQDCQTYLSQFPVELIGLVLHYFRHDKSKILVNRDGQYFILIENADLTILTKNYDGQISRNAFIEFDVEREPDDHSWGFDIYYLVGFTIRHDNLMNEKSKPVFFKPSEICILEHIGTTDLLGKVINNSKLWSANPQLEY